MLLAILSVQFGGALAKEVFAIAGPLWTGVLRISFAALMLGIAFRPRLARLTRAQWTAAIPYGVSLAAMNLSFYFAIDRIPLGLAVAVEFTGPLAVAILSSQRVLDVLWAILAVGGILLITPWTASHSVDSLGVFLALCAGMGWAAYILLGRRISRVFDGSQGVAVGMIAAALAAIASLTFLPGKVTWAPRMLLAGFGVALLSSALPYSLEMIALRALPARTFGILMSLEPAVAAGCGWLVLREKLSPLQCAAIALIIASSAGSTLSSRQLERPAEV